MSKRFFGCYGSEDMKTPNIDELASESIVFNDAWSNSTTTPGSYATIFSGLHPAHHKLDSEWGPYPKGIKSLPEVFNGQGYHTTMFSSEAELSRSKFGFSKLFDEVHGAIANPAQDGAVTIRTFEKWLNERPDKPFMSWLQFFDTHPPNLPPKKYSKEYYQGDPTKIENKPEDVKRVFGIESLVELNRSLPWIKKGILAAQPRHRFLETVRAFRGEQETGPDIYEHLKNLPPKARLNMDDKEFGNWLHDQINILIEGQKPKAEFIDWIEYVKKELEFIQEGIISWLKDVTDFDYPVSQYKACMAYFDELMGKLIGSLKKHGIFDQSTIVLVSPHGEILKYDDAVFHHHFPHPNVLSVPLILKTKNQKYKGKINGVVNLQDMAPSLTELFGMENKLETDGVSLVKNIITGSDITNDFSIGYDLCHALKSVAQPPYFYFRADEDYIMTPTKYGKAGDEFLFRLTDDENGIKEVSDNDQKKSDLRKKLDEFLSTL